MGWTLAVIAESIGGRLAGRGDVVVEGIAPLHSAGPTDLTLVVGAVAFSYAYFEHDYVPLQAVTVVFFTEFLIRLTLGLRYSPMGVIAHALTAGNPPDWVSAKPKRFAWTLGLGMSFAMVLITNSGIRGTLPRTICLICLTLMWMESVLGLCLGCKIHALLVRHGWATKDPAYEICAHGECKLA